MQMRRFTRLTSAFSKKIDSLGYAVALHFMHYNFCRAHQTLRVTPAMEAGIADHVWSIEGMVTCIGLAWGFIVVVYPYRTTPNPSEGGVMSRVTTALVSFALGVATTFLVLSGSHTSILAQAPPSQAPPPQAQPSMPNIVGGAGVPTVPPITQHFTDFGLAVPGMPFGVDGTECVRCVFNGQSFRYAGGNFQFTDFKFSGPVRVEFVGAARNTLIFLQFVQGLAAGQAPKRPSNPVGRDPIIRASMVRDTVQGSVGTIE
jgi:hypothetical protein